MEYIKSEILNGVTLLSVRANRFKTNETAITLALPLKNETASANALLINLLSRKCADYPNMLSLNRKLAHLYGASLSGGVAKSGECQILKLSLSSLDDRFSLDGESISLECIKLLCSMLFHPRLDENGDFYQEDIDAEKRILIEKIEAEENEKRTYVLRQTEKLMFADEPYSINRFGDVEQIKKLTADDIKNAWKNAVKSAKILVTVVGDTDIDEVKNYLSDCFAETERSYEKLPEAVFVPESTEVKRKTERMDVKQGKLVLGFRVNMKGDDKLTAAMRTFCDVFGGGPYSKLFANVREKMSLCYYCSARYTRQKSYIMIQCGCNEESMDKAVDEILNQLEIIKNGDFEEEFASSKMALRDSIMAVNDAPDMLEYWYAGQITDDDFKSPEMSVKENESVTAEQVKHCASLLSLDTVYKLAAPKEAE